MKKASKNFIIIHPNERSVPRMKAYQNHWMKDGKKKSEFNHIRDILEHLESIVKLL